MQKSQFEIDVIIPPLKTPKNIMWYFQVYPTPKGVEGWVHHTWKSTFHPKEGGIHDVAGSI
jgi:hypothetical protein